MRRKHAFEPTLADTLESRMLLSRAGIKNPSVLLSGLNPSAQGLNAKNAPSVVTQINTAFNSFVMDYSQTRGVYLSTLTPGAALTTDPNALAFRYYTRYRVDLLGQQLTSALIQGSGGNNGHQQKGLWVNFATVVQRRVNGLLTTAETGNDQPHFFRAGTLGRALVDSTPASNSSLATASLSALAQDQAIASSRVAVINGFIFNKNSSSHKSGRN